MKKGDVVIITKNLSKHRYPIGSVVTIKTVIQKSDNSIYMGADLICGQSYCFTEIECKKVTCIKQ